ncbi:UNVERIFIED_CONTAM: hypothetical protein Scaly_3041500 [Sesamum calycinum]|uniref:Reverse transcriptase domain-containing protein n=1 Tax=Sesamum calycinum TaxID=2727403 RepID=A0AAW2K6B3_9LAMI
MFEAVGEFFRTGKILKQINNTLLILIPKVNMPTFVSDYRPIACCNALYKAITKILVKRLQRVLPLMIDHSQNAFVPGRSISDNILLAQELLAGYNQARLPARCMLKVDIQKAYDSVEWDFLLETLRLFNFPQQFIILIEQCVSTASFSISLNGSIYGFFKSSRDFDRVILSHLIYSYWPLIDKVDARLAGWHHLRLSYAGRLQLIKSVLSTLHTYWASFYFTKGCSGAAGKKDEKPSFGMAQQVLEMRKLPGTSYANQKRKGGLGVRRLVTANQALILKQLWRILQNDGTSIWVDWIHQNRLRHTTIWTFNRDTGSWSWKKMLKLRPLLQRGVVYKVGDGSSFNLWQDIWHDRGPLCLNYPRGPASRGCLYPLHSPVCFSKTAGIGQPRQTPTLLKLYPSSLQHTLLHLIQFAGEYFWIARHGFILWLAMLEKLSTMDKPWIQGDTNGCVLCGGQFIESHNHLFFNCWYSKRCLAILKNEIKFQWPYEEWQRGITWASKRWRGNHLVNAALRATLAALVYRLWAERNNRIFAATSSPAEITSKNVLEDVRMRIMVADIS